EPQRSAIRAAGAAPDSLLPSSSARPRVAVLLPPSSALRAAIRLGRGTPNDVVELVDDPLAADYLLVGRTTGGATRLPRVRPNATAASQRGPSIPARTRWTDAGAAAAAADSVTDLATRLARLQGWLTLAAPPDTGANAFPYRIALRDRATGAVRESGETHE